MQATVIRIIALIVLISIVTMYTYYTKLVGLLILLVLTIVALILAYVKQNMFIYIPVVPGQHRSPKNNAFGLRHPNQHNLQSIDLRLVTQDGVKLRGWHVKAKESKRVVIYYHQNAGNIGNRLYYVENLVKTGCDIVLVAYRGYSDSQSSPSEQGIMIDAVAIMEYALSYSKQNRNIPVYVLGRSLGGAVAIYIASHPAYKYKIRGVILENTFTRVSDMAIAVLPPLKYVKFLIKNYWQSIDRMPSVIASALFIKCLKDQIVPCWQMEQLMRVAKCPIKQYIISEGSHNTSWILDPRKYFQEFQQFFYDLQH